MTSGPRALVTGATGFIGSHLLDHLEADGWRIGVLARPNAFKSVVGKRGVSNAYVYTGGTADVVFAVSEFQPDVVFHLGSLFLASHDSTQVEQLVSSNILFGSQILEAMKLSKVTALVNAGTSWQNYNGSAYNPVNLYAATKQAFEDILSYYAQTAGISAITLRLYDSYGPRDKRRKLLRLLLTCLKTNDHLSMSPGDQMVDLVHVHDICRAFLRAAELVRQENGARVYTISGGQRRTLRELVATFEEAAGKKLSIQFGDHPYRDREVMLPWVGPTLPGWKPEIKLLDGLRTLIADDFGFEAGSDLHVE